ncbi:MAG: DNA/RNA nuclease SfsA [Lachnospiraceae bacterium]
MVYENIKAGIFIKRPNRFLAHVEVEGQIQICHVKNTGRCRELLIPGVGVFVQYHPEAVLKGRKTEYSLISVYKETALGMVLVNMDSQAPNQLAEEWLRSGRFPFPGEITGIRREVKYGDSRFDLAFQIDGRQAFMEVKGVTLENDGIAMFPDAPTIRGVKHLRELAKAAEAGYEAFVLFVVQMKGITGFLPNEKTHPEFADALIAARESGVHVLIYDCQVQKNGLEIDQPVIPLF